MLRVWMFWILSLNSCQPRQVEEINTVIRNGAIFKKIENIVIYEKYVPLYFEMPRIPGATNIAKNECKNGNWDETLCPIWESVRIFRQMNEKTKYKEDLLYEDKEVTHHGPDGCCSQIIQSDAMPVVIPKAKYEEKKSKFLEKLIALQEPIFKILSVVPFLPQSILEIVSDLTRQLKKLREQGDEEEGTKKEKRFRAELIRTIQNQFGEIEQERILDHCREHRLPIQVVTPQILKENLENVTEMIRKVGLSISITMERHSHYYNKELTKCVFLENSTVFELRVPVTYEESAWELYEYNPIHFRFQDQICAISAHQAYIVVERESSQYVTIQGRNLRTCETEKGLCYVDRLQEDAAYSPLCAESILQNLPTEELNQNCNFRCEPRHKKVLVKKSSEYRYLVMNAEKELQLERSGRECEARLELPT